MDGFWILAAIQMIKKMLSNCLKKKKLLNRVERAKSTFAFSEHFNAARKTVANDGCGQ